MSDENKSMQQRVENEFVNSKDVGQSMKRLITEPPVAIIRRLISKYIALLVSIMDRMLEVLGIALTEPDKLYENIDDAKDKAQLLSMVMVKVLEDPVIRENIKQVAIALNDSALKPFFAVALITLKEMQPAIDEAEEQLIERLKEGIRRAGDGAWDAFENVIAGVPGFGNAWSAFSASMSLVQTGQTIIQKNLQLILESTYRILEMLRKVNVPGLEAVDSFIDFGLQAYNVYTNVTNKFDEFNATFQAMSGSDVKFVPNEGLTKKKIVEDMKKESDAAEAMMPDALQGAMDESVEEDKKEEESPDDDKPSEDSNKPSDDKDSDDKPSDDNKPSEDSNKQTDNNKSPDIETKKNSLDNKKPVGKPKLKKGGSRRKRKYSKRRTKKRALKKRH